METGKMNLIELNSIEKLEIYGGNAFVNYCYGVYCTIRDWYSVL